MNEGTKKGDSDERPRRARPEGDGDHARNGSRHDLRASRVRGPELFAQLSRALRSGRGRACLRRARARLPRLPVGLLDAELRPQPSRAQGSAAALHRVGRHLLWTRPLHARQGAVPRGARDEDPAVAAARLPGPAPGPDRDERRRGGAQARAQGHGPAKRHRLHERVPRRHARRPGLHGQSTPPPRRRAAARRRDPHALLGLPGRGRRGRWGRPGTRDARADALRSLERRGSAGGDHPRDGAGRGRPQRGERGLAAGSKRSPGGWGRC